MQAAPAAMTDLPKPLVCIFISFGGFQDHRFASKYDSLSPFLWRVRPACGRRTIKKNIYHVAAPRAPASNGIGARALAAKQFDVLSSVAAILATLFGPQIGFDSSYACAQRGLYRASAREKINHKNDECYDKQQVNQAAAKMTKKPDQPENHQHDQDCPQHDPTLLQLKDFSLILIESLIDTPRVVIRVA
jgi:hypothetical protein